MTTGYEWAKRTKTNQLYAELMQKPHKYGAKKTTVFGIKFDSKREAEVYGELRLRERAGEIFGLEVQPEYDLIINNQRIAKYKADFRYQRRFKIDDGRTGVCQEVVDVKSAPTAKRRDFALIRKLMKAIYGVEIMVVT